MVSILCRYDYTKEENIISYIHKKITNDTFHVVHENSNIETSGLYFGIDRNNTDILVENSKEIVYYLNNDTIE